jgi:hypothetical protein
MVMTVVAGGGGDRSGGGGGIVAVEVEVEKAVVVQRS